MLDVDAYDLAYTVQRTTSSPKLNFSQFPADSLCPRRPQQPEPNTGHLLDPSTQHDKAS